MESVDALIKGIQEYKGGVVRVSPYLSIALDLGFHFFACCFVGGRGSGRCRYTYVNTLALRSNRPSDTLLNSC